MKASPERARQPMHAGVPPFQGFWHGDHKPRALPWAGLCQPFRLSEDRVYKQALERLGFRRYEPAIAPGNLSHLLDGIAEDVGEGAPSEVLGVNYYGDSTGYPLRFAPEISRMKKTESDIACSFINIKPKRALNWLCHAHLYSREGWVYVVFHASPSVTDPETISFVTWASCMPAVVPPSHPPK